MHVKRFIFSEGNCKKNKITNLIWNGNLFLQRKSKTCINYFVKVFSESEHNCQLINKRRAIERELQNGGQSGGMYCETCDRHFNSKLGNNGVQINSLLLHLIEQLYS